MLLQRLGFDSIVHPEHCQGSIIPEELDENDFLVKLPSEETEKFKFSWYLTFGSKDTETEWIFQNMQLKKQLIFGLTVLYVIYGLVLNLNIIFRKSPLMGGQFPLIALLVWTGISSCMILSMRYSSKVCQSICNHWRLAFMVILYPLSILRCFGFVLFYASSTFEEKIEFGGWEDFSFWCFIYFGQGLYFFGVEAPFLLAAPIFLLGSSCFLISALVIVPNEGANERNSSFLLMQFFMSVLVIIVFYFMQKAKLEIFVARSMYERSLEREKELCDQQGEHQLNLVSEITKEKSVMFGQLAHDIGTPLAAINMAVELLEDFVVDNEQRDSFDAIYASVASISVLRQSMLDYVKKASGALIKPAFDSVDIWNLISKKAFNLLKHMLIKKKNVEARMEIDPRLKGKKFFSAENWLLDMLLNYISNAVKFTDEGFVKVSASLELNLTLSGSSSAEMVRFEVKDTGSGVPKDKIDNLFKEFSQLQNNRGGTGLGLSSVKDKADILGGKVGFLNNKDFNGSTFFFSLPFNQALSFSGSYNMLQQSACDSIKTPLASMSHRALHRSTVSGRQSLSSCEEIFCMTPLTSKSQRAIFNRRKVSGRQSVSSVVSEEKMCTTPLTSMSHRAIFNRRKVSGRQSVSSGVSEEKLCTPTPLTRGRKKKGTDSKRKDPKKFFSSSPSHSSMKEFESARSSLCNKLAAISPSQMGERFSSDYQNCSLSPATAPRALSDLSFNDTYNSSSDRKKLTVMIVDDSPILLALYKRMAEKVGVQKVYLAKDAEDCLEQVLGCKPIPHLDYIITDDQMPGMRGPELVKELFLQSHLQGRPCPDLYICTGSPPNLLENEFSDIHQYAKDIIEKPLNQTQMRSIFYPEYSEAPVVPLSSESKVNEKDNAEEPYAFHSDQSFRLDTKCLLTNHSDVLRTLRGRMALEPLNPHLEKHTARSLTSSDGALKSAYLNYSQRSARRYVAESTSNARKNSGNSSNCSCEEVGDFSSRKNILPVGEIGRKSKAQQKIDSRSCGRRLSHSNALDESISHSTSNRAPVGEIFKKQNLQHPEASKTNVTENDLHKMVLKQPK